MGRMHANVYGALTTAELAAVVDHRPEKLDKFSSLISALPAYSIYGRFVFR